MGEVASTRSDQRVRIDAFVKVLGGDGDKEYVLRTRDLSRGGLFLYTRVAHSYPFRVGSTLTLELYDYDRSVTCKAVVVRVVEEGSAEADHYPCGFGLRIVGIDDANGERLGHMIEQAAGGQGPY